MNILEFIFPIILVIAGLRFRERRHPMKNLIFCSILFCVIALPALGELTDADLNKIRLIVKEKIKEELKPIKAEIASIKADTGMLKTDVARLEGRLSGVEKQISHATNVTYGLIALIVVAIGISAWRGKKDREQERKIEALTQEIETLKENYGKRN